MRRMALWFLVSFLGVEGITVSQELQFIKLGLQREHKVLISLLLVPIKMTLLVFLLRFVTYGRIATLGAYFTFQFCVVVNFKFKKRIYLIL